MLLLLKTFMSRQNVKKHKLLFYIWEKEALFSLCGQYSITYSNESWGNKGIFDKHDFCATKQTAQDTSVRALKSHTVQIL